MSEVLGSIWWMIVALGVLVTFHEFGHYWVARRCGVKVLRFSVGFGKPLWTRVGRDGTEKVLERAGVGSRWCGHEGCSQQHKTASSCW